MDIAALASYLHLTPQQIERLANRGQLPGRKVRGQWRFSRAEIHFWIEQRMGLMDEDELAHVEEAVLKPMASGDDAVTISRLLRPEAIAIPLAARTRSRAIEAMTELAAETGLLWDREKMAEAVRAREQMQSTALDIGVALLHPRRPMPAILAQPLLALGCTIQGIPFGGRRALTDIFFLICSTDDRHHLRTLARLSRLISSPDVLTGLREAADPETAYRLLCNAEARLDE